MSLLDLSDVVSDPDLSDNYTILRSTGGFVAGGWADTRTPIPAFGVVSIASEKDLENLPEGARVREARVFHSTQQMFLVNETNRNLSDILVFNGTKYLAYSAKDYSNFGYYQCVASRMEGN